MNKVCKKISLIAVIILAVGIGVFGVGFFLGGTNPILFEDGHFIVFDKNNRDEVDIIDETFSKVENITIDVDYFDKVVLKEGDTFAVKGSNPKVLGGLKATLDGGTLTIADYSKETLWIMNFGFFNGFGSKDNGPLEITYPSDAVLGDVILNVNMGSVEISDLKANNIAATLDMGDINLDRVESDDIALDLNMGSCDINGMTVEKSFISLDAGDLDIKGVKSGGLEVDSNMGKVSIEGVLLGKSTFEMDMGDLTLLLAQSKDETSFSVNLDLGSVRVNGEKRDGSMENTIKGSKNSIIINSDFGDVKMDFEK